MLAPDYTAQFRRDLKKVQHRGYDMDKLKQIITTLLEERPLNQNLRDHPLKGEWKDYRELHIAPDWLLVYRIADGAVYFTRTGTHADIFEE